MCSAFLSTSPFCSCHLDLHIKLVFFFFFKFMNMCDCHFQLSAVELSRKSPLAGSCLLDILLHMSTTCTVCGPSRQPLEAPSGLKHSPFPLLLHFGSHSLFQSTFIFPIPQYPFSVVFITCTGCCVISPYPGCYWPMAELPWAERKYPSKPAGLRRHQSTFELARSLIFMYFPPLPFLDFDPARHSVFQSRAGCRFRLFSIHQL